MRLRCTLAAVLFAASAAAVVTAAPPRDAGIVGAGDAPAYPDPFRWFAAGDAGSRTSSLASPSSASVLPGDARRLRLMGIVRHGPRAVALISSGNTTFLVREGQAVQPGGGTVAAIGDGVVTIRWPSRDARDEETSIVQHLTFQEAAP